MNQSQRRSPPNENEPFTFLIDINKSSPAQSPRPTAPYLMQQAANATMTDGNTEMELPRLADSVVAPEPEVEGVITEGEVTAKAEEVGFENTEEIPLPPPLEPAPMPEPASQPTSQPVDEAMEMVTTPGEITITDQDVLFGRGGLTNRHIGNLRYRDIISIHREDYVRAQKTEKPNVARRIVKAIRTGKNPGRFLRKGDGDKWICVSDKEAAWKASQALREKSRWSSMKEDTKQPASLSAAALAIDFSTVQTVAETANLKAEENDKKRKAEEEPEVGDGAVDSEIKKVKSEQAPSELSQPELPVETVPTDISHITVPPVETLGGRKLGANYMLTVHTDSNDMFPKDEDILFGRGGRTNHHPGNKRLRDIVIKYRDTYNKAKKVDKPKVSKLIVSALRGSNPPSRFLRMNEETTRWEDVGDKRAAEKVSQTLREKDRDAKAEYVARKTVTESLETQASEAVAITATAHVAVQAAPEEMANAVEVAPQQAQVQLFDV